MFFVRVIAKKLVYENLNLKSEQYYWTFYFSSKMPAKLSLQDTSVNLCNDNSIANVVISRGQFKSLIKIQFKSDASPKTQHLGKFILVFSVNFTASKNTKMTSEVDLTDIVEYKLMTDCEILDRQSFN